MDSTSKIQILDVTIGVLFHANPLRKIMIFFYEYGNSTYGIDYCIDVCRLTNKALIECMWYQRIPHEI